MLLHHILLLADHMQAMDEEDGGQPEDATNGDSHSRYSPTSREESVDVNPSRPGPSNSVPPIRRVIKFSSTASCSRLIIFRVSKARNGTVLHTGRGPWM
jgi:hypothetical protein